MRVAFLHLDVGQKDARKLAEIMVRSVKQTMPGVEVVHLADPRTPMVVGSDAVIRKKIEYPWIMQYRLAHFRDFEGDAMFIDTDAVVLKDPRLVFDEPFDVALTRRTGPIFVDGKDIVPDQPYNTGVMFSRSQEWWKAVFDECWTYSDKLKNWFGDQMAVKVVSESGKFNVKELTCDEFNYSPNREDEDLSGRYIGHWKGQKRKSWMLNKYLEVA